MNGKNICLVEHDAATEHNANEKRSNTIFLNCFVLDSFLFLAICLSCSLCLSFTFLFFSLCFTFVTVAPSIAAADVHNA